MQEMKEAASEGEKNDCGEATHENLSYIKKNLTKKHVELLRET
jgi:hypothetical protein